MMIKIDKDELRNFINYLNDKVEGCYQDETDKAVQRFFKEYRIQGKYN